MAAQLLRGSRGLDEMVGEERVTSQAGRGMSVGIWSKRLTPPDTAGNGTSVSERGVARRE